MTSFTVDSASAMTSFTVDAASATTSSAVDAAWVMISGRCLLQPHPPRLGHGPL